MENPMYFQRYALLTIVLTFFALSISYAQPEWIAHTITDSYNSAHSVRLVDMDNDGDIDILSTSYDEGCSIWWNLGDQLSEEIVDDQYGMAHAEAADMDNDGDLDIVAGAHEDDLLILYTNNDGTFGRTIIDENANFIYHLDIADLNNDGLLDIVTANRYDNEVRIWARVDDVWTGFTLTNVIDDPRRVEISDFSQDGWADILVSGYESDDIHLFLNSGNGQTWTALLVASNVDKAFGILGADVDDDGDPDILASAHATGDVGWIENEPPQNFRHPIDNSFVGARDMMHIDVDGDNVKDILAVSYYEGVGWWSNFMDDYTFHEIDTEGHGGSSIDAADIDNDGDLDIVSCGYLDHSIIWYEQLGQPGPVTIELTPDVDPVIIPPSGGTVYYDMHLINHANLAFTAEYSTYVRLPSGSLFGPTSTTNTTIVPFMDQTITELEQFVPSSAPAGVYEMIGQLRYDDNEIAESRFTFRKEGTNGPVSHELNGWIGENPALQSNESTYHTIIPSSYAMYAAYPNPFNPSTQLTVTLPKGSNLTVNVFNATGQIVTSLVSGQFPTGEHSFTFNAQNLAGGVYFIHADVPGKLSAVQKVVYLK
jgi:FG-GAP-like repeat/Secretion system C-terminal sorting domain